MTHIIVGYVNFEKFLDLTFRNKKNIHLSHTIHFYSFRKFLNWLDKLHKSDNVLFIYKLEFVGDFIWQI